MATPSQILLDFLKKFSINGDLRKQIELLGTSSIADYGGFFTMIGYEENVVTEIIEQVPFYADRANAGAARIQTSRLRVA